jgi:hypothetical protein
MRPALGSSGNSSSNNPRTRRFDLVEKLKTNLVLYMKGQPCRTPWTDDDPVHHPQPADQ